MHCPIEDFLWLVLGVFSDLFSVTVYKNSEVFKATAKKRFELVSHDRDKAVCILSPLILLSAEIYPVSEEKRGKKNLVSPCSSRGSKKVLTLLIKVIAVYIRLFTVHIWETGLQQLILGLLKDGGSWGWSGSGSLSLQNGLKNLLQVIFGILEDISNSNGRFWP